MVSILSPTYDHALDWFPLANTSDRVELGDRVSRLPEALGIFAKPKAVFYVSILAVAPRLQRKL